MATKIIHSMTTECSCGYGRGSWADSPALKDPPQPPLTPDSTECPGCSQEFTDEIHDYVV